MLKRLFAILLLLPLPVFALEVPAAPIDYILDQAGVLSSEFETELVYKLTELEAATTAEIGVLMITSLEDEALEPFANEVFRTWGVGSETADNGVLILVAVEDREARIEVGYGLEGRITDADARYILDNVMIPEFRDGDYEMGINFAVDALTLEIQAEAEEYGFDRAIREGQDSEELIIGLSIVLFFLFIFSSIVYSFIPKKKRVKIQRLPILPAITFILLLISAAPTLAWVVGAVLSTVFYLILRVSSFENKGGGRGGWTSGGFGGGSSGGGFSGGGFGGGSSGGGGASSSW